VFPRTPLVLTIEAGFGADRTADPATWALTDLTDRWEAAIEVSIKDGGSEGATQAEAGEITLALKNPDGQLTPDDPRSQWWPYVTEGTPLRLTLNAGFGDQVFTAYISTIAPSHPGRSKHLALVTITARGAFEWLGRGKALKPPLQRATVAAGAVQVWPLDDGRDATQAASVVIAGTPLTVVGEPEMAAVDGPAGAQQRMPEFVTDAAYNGALVASLALDDTAGWTVEAWFRAKTAAPDAFATFLSWRTTGTFGTQWILTAVRSGGTTHIVNVTAVRADGSSSSTNLFDVEAYDGRWHHVRVSAHQDTATQITRSFWLDGVLVASGATSSFTIGRPTSIKVGGYGEFEIGDTESLSVCYAAIYGTDAPAQVYTAGLGYVGETASDRIDRVSTELGVPVVIVAGESAPMGAQPAETYMAIIRECAATDGGRLSEHNFGVKYRPLSALYNQTPALVIDIGNRELSDPYDPVLDLQKVRNEWKVSRRNGSSATYADPEHQKLRGQLADAATINPQTDDVLLQHAAHLTKISTTPAMRHPSLSINLNRSPQLIAAWQALQIGDRVQAVNGLPQMPPQPVNQIVEGRVQTIKGRRWRATMITSPASPYTVGVLDDPVLGRADGDASTLVAELTAGHTGTFQVATSAGPLWVTNAAFPTQFPLLVTIAGEEIEIGGISGASSPQTFTIRGRATNGVRKNHPAGSPVRVTDAFVLSR
jgi:hypothetical protein